MWSNMQLHSGMYSMKHALCSSNYRFKKSLDLIGTSESLGRFIANRIAAALADLVPPWWDGLLVKPSQITKQLRNIDKRSISPRKKC